VGEARGYCRGRSTLNTRRDRLAAVRGFSQRRLGSVLSARNIIAPGGAFETRTSSK